MINIILNEIKEGLDKLSGEMINGKIISLR